MKKTEIGYYNDNILFYSCRRSDLASEWQRGWSWPGFDTDLAALFVQIKSSYYYDN